MSRTLRWSIGRPAGVVPAAATEPNAVAVVDAVFDSLTAVDADGAVVPAAATGWEPIGGQPDHWRFHLRPGGTFHDGTPVTAEDFAFGWAEAVRAGAAGLPLEAVAGYAEVSAGVTAGLRGVTAPDSQTLEVQLVRPDAELPAVVSTPSLAPLPRAAYARDPAAFQQQPVGNGPFAVTERVDPSRFVRTARFLEWRNGAEPARIDGVLFEVEDLDTGYLAFRQGRRDFVSVPPEAIADAAVEFPDSDGDPTTGPGLLTPPQPTVYLLVFNATHPAVADVRVRRTISLAVDREEIADQLGGAFPAGVRDRHAPLVPATALLPPGLPGALPGACNACRFDVLPGAAQLFEEQGVEELDFAFNADGGHEVVRDVLADGLGLAVPRVTLVSNARGPSPDFTTYLARLRAGTVTVFRFGWGVESPSLGALLRPLLHSESIPSDANPEGRNYGRYANPAVDELLDEAAAELDPGHRAALFRQAERLALNVDQALAPVVTYRRAAVAAGRVQGLRLSPFGAVNLGEVSLAPA